MSYATFTPRSASITSFKTADGKNLALHFENELNYSRPENQFLGASIGRVANRIYGENIEVAGKTWPLNYNKESEVTLHGGVKGWDKADWKGGETKTVNGKEVTVFTHHSPHLDQGFPGSVDAKVTYTSYKQVDPADNIEKVYLELEYEAVLAEDSPVDETVISLTNHNFFNVSEAGVTNAGTQLKVFSNQTILHDQETLVPTGQIGAHPDISADLDFFTLTKTEPEIDHAFFVEDSPEFKGLDTREYRAVQPHVHIYNPESKINVVVGSTEPVFQVYTGKFMNIPLLPGESRTFEKNSCIACEPARPTNAAKTPKWKNWVLLKKGEKYGSKTVYTNWVSK